MSEIVFVVECADEDGFTAKAVNASIVTEAETEAALRDRVRNAVHCHFEPAQRPKIIRLHHVRDEVIVA